MKLNKNIVESSNSYIKHQFIKRNSEGEIFEKHSMRIREQREKPGCTFEQKFITEHFGNTNHNYILFCFIHLTFFSVIPIWKLM